MIDDPKLYRRLVEASTDGLWLLDGEGRTLYANPRMADLLGRTPEQMEGLSAYDVHDEQGKREFAEHLRKARSGDGGHDDREAMYLRADGSPIWLLASWRPVRDDDGTLIGFLHHYSDYTEQRRLIHALEHREHLLAEAQSIARIGGWEWDAATRRSHWSDELFRIFRISREEFAASKEGFLDFIHPEDRAQVVHETEKVFHGADDVEWQARIIRGDGEIRWMRGLGRAERAADGTLIRVVGTDQDITDKVQADQEIADYTNRLALLRQVAEAANQSQGLVETLIRSADALKGTPEWEPLVAFVRADGGELRPLIEADPDLPFTQPPVPALAERAWQSGRLEHMPVVGHEHSHSLVAIPIMHRDGVACVVELVGEEVPPREISRDLMAQFAIQLGRVAERERAAAELAEARDQAMEASRLKSEFLATMSHEIRTPMNGVVGLNDLLLRTELDPRQRRLAEALHGAGLTLRGIINDILDLSKIEAGKLELELVDFDVRAVVRQTVGLLARQAEDKGLELALCVAPDVPTYVRGDAVRWAQIMSNLVSNAVKFTDEGRVDVSVTLRHAEPGRPVLEVAVTDTGAGIPADSRERLFDAFTQADPSTTRRHGGTGLGLTIARQLVEALGGELSVDSRVGSGSTFRFSAPFGPASSDNRDMHAETADGVSLEPVTQRVLVVEDNEVNQMVAVGLLESAGYAADVAADGIEAVAALRGDHPYAAVLMDIRMPRMDGFAATREIRAQEPEGARVPVIAMTASALEGERERCLEAGMDDFLTKPVDTARMQLVVAQWVGSGHPAPAPAPRPGRAEPEGDVVDVTRIEMLHEMVKDGESLFQRSSGNFIAHAAAHLTAIAAAVERADAEQLTATAHKLKGSALNLGLPRVGAAAFELEEQGRAGLLKGADTAFASLSREMRRAVSALEQERALRE